LDNPHEEPQKLMDGYFGSMVDLNRLCHWIVEGKEPVLSEYERLTKMFEEGQRRGAW
jgi:hypothetical protein